MIWNTSETVSITYQPCHSQFCCWLLPIWPLLGVLAENGAYVLCRLGWRYDRAKLSFSWPYMIISMIWNKSELSVSHLSRTTAFLLLIAANLAQAGFMGWKLSLWPDLTWLALQLSKAVFFLTLYHSINDMKHCWTFCITSQPCHNQFCFLMADNLALAGFLGWKWSLWPLLTSLALQLSKAVFFMILYDIINDMKHFQTLYITPHPALVYFHPYKKRLLEIQSQIHKMYTLF